MGPEKVQTRAMISERGVRVHALEVKISYSGGTSGGGEAQGELARL